MQTCPADVHEAWELLLLQKQLDVVQSLVLMAEPSKKVRVDRQIRF